MKSSIPLLGHLSHRSGAGHPTGSSLIDSHVRYRSIPRERPINRPVTRLFFSIASFQGLVDIFASPVRRGAPTSRVGEPAEEAIWVRRGPSATVSVRGAICGRNGPAANLTSLSLVHHGEERRTSAPFARPRASKRRARGWERSFA